MSAPGLGSCPACGGSDHARRRSCPFDLHGDDAFKTSCAVCGLVIPSGAPRNADAYGNLYCSPECMAEGYDRLRETKQKEPT